LARTALGVIATAVIGGLATDPDSAWYRALRKPPWQPPPPAYGLVWTPLYADLAVVGARTLDRLPDGERRDYRRALVANLVLNAGWNWLFFRARRPWLAVVECAALTASSADLVRRTARSEPGAAAALAPYPLWCAFATALTAALARRNPRAGR
jgi:tryptophan-rich sensory protein